VLSIGFIPPCLPTKAKQPPYGGAWLHEIKHEFRVIARKDGNRVELYSRPGNDLTDRFPLIVEALARLHSRSCIIDGEAVACDDNGVPSFDRIRYRRYDGSVFLCAFDLIELNGDDLRRDPIEVRKTTLASVLAKAASGLRFTSTSNTRTVRSCSPTPARWVSRASCRSAKARPIALDDRLTG
jgi:bifunctional non-homologous end joining protein LigD